jgi:transposase
LDRSLLIGYTRFYGEAAPADEDVMIQIAFTDAEIAALEYERYRHPSPQVQKRMEVVYLKSQAVPHQEIARLCRISRQTVVTILHLYQQEGIERLKRFHFAGQPSALNQHQSTLEAHFRTHPPRTVAQAQAEIEQLTGIRRSPTQIRAFLKRIGMQVRKVGAMPGRAHDPLKQQEQDSFQQTELEPRLQEVRQGKRTLFLSTPPTSSMARS